MNKTWKLFTCALLLCISPAMAAPAVPSQTSSQCIADSIFAPAPAATGTDLFMPQPVNNQGPPTCEVLCVSSPCSSNADCTAEPNGRCDYVCPGTGCCVYR